MLQRASAAEPSIAFPPLSVLRARLTYRLLEDTTLPTYKGALLRGGFGYAFQCASCARPCWGHAERCGAALLCPYRWVFETPHPAGVEHFHDLQDVPRPFVIEPPLDHKQRYAAGDALEFGLVLIGRGVDFLPYFLVGFEELGATGLGRDMAKARFERVEALEPFRPVGVSVYQDGRAVAPPELPLLNMAELPARAAGLPPDLHTAIVADHAQTPAQVLASLTTIRRQTSVDAKSGAPEPGSLRAARAVIRGVDLVAPLDLRLPDDERPRAEALLAACALGVRRGGLSRNRGRGRLALLLHRELPADEGDAAFTRDCFERFAAEVRA